MKSTVENKPAFDDRVIRMGELQTIFGVCKRTVRRKSEIGDLPPLVHSGGVVGMLESKVKEYFRRLSQQGAN
jgi:predicted DNA-binding transcriptional regulator AlpA